MRPRPGSRASHSAGPTRRRSAPTRPAPDLAASHVAQHLRVADTHGCVDVGREVLDSDVSRALVERDGFRLPDAGLQTQPVVPAPARFGFERGEDLRADAETARVGHDVHPLQLALMPTD